jgi:type IV pilus assembly protein PilC
MPLISASASSGDPSHILHGLIDESLHVGELRRRFSGALAYPLLLLAVLLVLMAGFSWWLVPTFEDIFADFGIACPDVTRFVFGMSEAIRRSGGLVILIPGLVLAAIIVSFSVGPRSGLQDWIIQRTPVFGSTVRLSGRARFTRCLADLMEAEVPVADALRISGQHTGQTALRQEAARLATEMASGSAESAGSPSFRRILSHTVIHVLQLRSDPKAAAKILRELSWMYDQQTRNRLACISSITSPVFVVVLGAIVGLYVFALFAPLISLIQKLS